MGASSFQSQFGSFEQLSLLVDLKHQSVLDLSTSTHFIEPTAGVVVIVPSFFEHVASLPHDAAVPLPSKLAQVCSTHCAGPLIVEVPINPVSQWHCFWKRD